MKTTRSLIIAAIMLLIAPLTNDVLAFCGFYVAKADVKLFNKSSQVIISRMGDRSVITMSNDYQGNLKDFAMVVPVPEILKREDIRVISSPIFETLDAYSGPRLVEYNDVNPCIQPIYKELDMNVRASSVRREKAPKKRQGDLANKDYKVTIEAEYKVGEYDILILSAKESDGLERWLTDNGYKIPPKAADVLKPYVRNKLKFFVVKVDLDNQKKSGFQNLRPIQISFNSDKFMLPIRLGMANANGDQDMIVYCLSPKGRTEVANYRTAELPTNRNIPTFIRREYGEFYKAVFENAWEKEGKRSVMLEYAWDLSASNSVKCDPCPSPPPNFSHLAEAGAFWLTSSPNSWGSGYTGDVFITRLHVRYNRQNFPQDLFFMDTPNRTRFQGRYVMQNPAGGDLNCEAGKQYVRALYDRRKRELEELSVLTGWETSRYNWYLDEYGSMLDTNWRGEIREEQVNPEPNKRLKIGGTAFIILFGAAGLFGYFSKSGKQDEA